MQKKAVSIIILILSLILSSHAIAFYDNFESTTMDKDKWRWQDLVRSVSDGKLNLNVKSCGENDIWATPIGNATPFMKANVLVHSDSFMPESAFGMMRLAGQFYNDSRGEGSGQDYNGFEGEVRAEIFINLLADGELRARGQVWRFNEADHFGDNTEFFSQDFQTPINFDVENELSIDFTGTSIVFKCNGAELTYVIPGPIYPSHESERYLTSRVVINEYTGHCGYLKTQVDNVSFEKNGIIYDTFDGQQLDSDKWHSGEFIRQIEDTKLRLKVERCNGRGNNTVSPTGTNESGYIEAKVIVNAGEVAQEQVGYARLGSYFYNEKRGPGSNLDYDGYQDNVWSTIKIALDDSGSLKAFADVYRSDVPDESSGTSLFSENFNTSIELGQEYLLYMRFTGSKIFFGCDNEILQYNITSPVYESYDKHYYLQTRIFNEDHQCGFIDTTYHDISIASSPVTATILSNATPDHTITSGSNEQVYGTSTANTITLERGAKAELINFPGQNSIEIQSSSDLFTVSRSGTIVTFEGSDGTILKIPATTSVQTVDFSDRLPMTLHIHGGQVMLDDQVVTTTPVSISPGEPDEEHTLEVTGPAYELIPAVVTPGSGQPVQINYYGYPDTIVVEIERRDGTLIPLVNVPNTNKWTINLPETEVLEDHNPLNLLNFIGILETVDGTGPSDYVQLFAPVLRQDMISVSPGKLSENVQASLHIVNIRYDALYSDENSISNINKIFFQHFNDDYDFIVQNWLTRDSNMYQHYVGIRNDIQGTGIEFFDFTEIFGADGTQRLKGLVYFSPNGSIDLADQVVSHEIGHAFMNFLKDTPLSTNTAHFPVSTTAFGIIGPSGPRTNVKLTMLSNGDFRVESRIPFGDFNEFELYMMGLIPSTEVPDQIVFDDQTATLIPGTTLAGPGTTVTIDQVISSHGHRIPAYPMAQKEFNVATIVISRGRLLSVDEMTYLDYMAARGEATVALDDYTKRSFYVSTGGRASLSTSIHFPDQ